MNLYRKLFGVFLMAPADDGSNAGGGGSADRGDDFTPSDAGDTGAAAADNDTQLEDDVKLATGEKENTEEDDSQPRDAAGKFSKKDRAEASIPKARFDEAVRKEREAREVAERQLEEIRRQQAQVSRGVDISKLEGQVKELRAAERKALVSGDDQKAAELSEQADRLNRQIAIEQASDMSARAKEQAREEIRWDLTIESIEAKYPELDEKSDSFDQELTDDVVDKMNGYVERERLPRSQALVKAVQYIMNRRAAAAPADDKGASKGLDRGSPAKDRKEAAVAKNIDASKRQPASTKQVGADSDKHGQTKDVPEADAMTYEEFSALPDATKAKMRGDYV